MLKEIKGFFAKTATWGNQVLPTKFLGKHPITIFGFKANKFVEIITKRNVCTEFEENRLKTTISRVRAHIKQYSFNKPLKTCSVEQDQCSFHDCGFGSYHGGHMNHLFISTSRSL